MHSKFLDIIAGARPNFVKIAPIIKELNEVSNGGANVGYRLIHTGQHYDYEMSTQFFEDLGLPKPCVNLGVGSGSQAEQTARLMVEYERVIHRSRPSLTMVVGDVNSTMACAITAAKCQVPVAHVEAGIRSRDMAMPEEVNRIVTDRLSRWLFTTSEFADNNLFNEGCPKEQVFRVGNTMIDSLIANQSRFRPNLNVQLNNLQKSRYWVVTLHRPNNVDSPLNLLKTLTAIEESAGNIPIIFPIHPRTKKVLETVKKIPDGFILSDPLGYLEFMHLVKNSIGVVTDSGGISEETTFFGIPCITLRESTERPETVTIGTNELVGVNSDKIRRAMECVIKRNWKVGRVPELWDGLSSKRIVKNLVELID